jgi:hypothetical protein
MSRGFVKDADETLTELPERPISPHPNIVTAEGLIAIETALARLRQETFPEHHRAVPTVRGMLLELTVLECRGVNSLLPTSNRSCSRGACFIKDTSVIGGPASCWGSLNDFVGASEQRRWNF